MKKNIPIPEPSITGRPEKLVSGVDEKIRDGVQVPAITGRLSYPWEQMEIGDSFFAPDRASKQLSGHTPANRFKQRKFIFRTAYKDGVKGTRGWRIK